jgi:hypothetical protein
MKRVDQSLQKLLSAASTVSRQTPSAPPFALEAAVIAQCRGGGRRRNDPAPLLWLFRRAAIFALVVMMLSGAWNYFGNKNNTVTATLVSNALMQLPP